MSEFNNDGLQDGQEAVGSTEANPSLEDQLQVEHRSSSGSGSEYLNSTESENDEPDTGVMAQSGGKKQKKGLMGRDQIRKIRSHLPSEVSNSEEHVGQKRKAAQNQE